MKKFIVLILTLCVLAFAFPAFAAPVLEEGGSKLEDQVAAIMDGEESTEDKASALIALIDNLKDSFTGTDTEFSAVLDSLDEKVQGLIGPAEEGLGDLVSGIKDTLAGIGEIDLGGLLGGLFGGIAGDTDSESGNEGTDLGSILSGLFGGTGDENGSESENGDLDLNSLLGDLFGDSDLEDEDVSEDDEDIAETIERLNKEAELETGEDVPNKKAAESVEEFYGEWIETKFYFNGEEYDMSDFSEGVHIAEDSYYFTEDGEKSTDYMRPEKAELSILEGALKVQVEGNWTTFVLTEDGELVMVDSSMMTYFVPVEE